jgi:hypothetical protein
MNTDNTWAFNLRCSENSANGFIRVHSCAFVANATSQLYWKLGRADFWATNAHEWTRIDNNGRTEYLISLAPKDDEPDLFMSYGPAGRTGHAGSSAFIGGPSRVPSIVSCTCVRNVNCVTEN